MGKTSLAVSFTAPEGAEDINLVHYFNFDFGLERAYKALQGRIDQFPGSEESFIIHPYEFDPEGDLDLEEAADLFERWEEDWLSAHEDIKENNGGVLIFDTETMWTTIVTIIKTNAALQNRLAKRKEGKDGVDYVQRLDYGDRNAYIEKVMQSALALPNTNLVLVSRADPVFDGAKETNELKPAGFKWLGNLVDAQIFCYKMKSGAYKQRIDFDGFESDHDGDEFDGLTYTELCEELDWG